MPLQDLFEEQIDQLRAFMEFPGLPLLDLRYGGEMDRMVGRILLGLQDEEANPHLMVLSELEFLDARQYFTALQAELVESSEQQRQALQDEGVQLPNPPAGPRLDPVSALAQYASNVADSFPDTIGSYVIILKLPRVASALAFAEAMRDLANIIRSDWAKFILLDDRGQPLLPDIEKQSERVMVQDFHFAPEKIEAQVNADLARGRLPHAELRQYTAMAAAFAFSNGKLDRAVELQQRTLGLAEKDGTPADQAGALYNLGNTRLKQQQFADAEAAYVRAAQICLEQKLNPLLAMVMSNLGLTLHHLQHQEESLQCLEVARRTFAAINNLPGEAYALDTKAGLLAAQGRNEDAEQTWLKAIALYDEVRNPDLGEVRQGGRNDLVAKLNAFYQATGQPAKALPGGDAHHHHDHDHAT